MKKYLSLIAIMALMVTYAMAQAPVYTGVPDVKLYAGKSLSGAFDLEVYNTSDAATIYSVVTGTDVATISAGAPGTINYYGLTEASNNWRNVAFQATNEGGDGIATQVVKYSTYLVKKLGRAVLGATDSETIDISAAVNAFGTPSYPGVATWPASFDDGGATSVVADAGVTAAIDTAAQTLTISNTSALSGKKLVRIEAAPATAPNATDYDKGILQVFPNLATNGKFDSSLSGWTTQLYADGTEPIPTPTVATSFAGKTNVYKANLTIGKKIKSTQVVYGTTPNTWYTARAKVATDATNVSGSKLKTYLYVLDDPLGGLPRSAHDVGANGMMDGPNVWNQMEISFYSRATVVALQIVSISPATATASGDLYWDDVEFFQAPPAVEDSDLTYGYTKVAVNNGTFDSNTAGWWPQVYADGTDIGTIAWAGSVNGKSGVYSISQTVGQKAKITQASGVAEAPLAEELVGGKSFKFSAFVCTSAAAGQAGKYYAYVYSYNTSYGIRRSAASIIQPGTLTQNTWEEIKVGGVLFTDIAGIQVVAICPTNKSAQIHYIDDVTVAQDKDPIYFWDSALTP
ncbi:MAG: hypothetical protein ACE14V_13610 [bacterium]